MANELENILYVYDKNMNLLALFDGNTEGASDNTKKNMVVAPTIKQVQNGESTLSFQILANSTKWQQIKGPENLFYINGKYYTLLNNGSVTYTGEGSIRIANVVAVETWYLLNKQYNQAYNCGLYTYAKATFQSFTPDGAIFRITSTGCSNPGNTITAANAWSQVKLWRAKDKNGNQLSYSILKGENYAPTKWENAPAAVAFSSFNVSGNTATVTIKPIAKDEVQQNFEYSPSNSYTLENKPYPVSLKNVYVNSTIVTTSNNLKRYTTSNKEVKYTYNSSTGKFSLSYTPVADETINYVIVIYEQSNMGTISAGATCTFAFGAEVVDEHTFLVLPKADTRYKLTVDGVEYNDSQVKDSRGAIMPRGSGGYAMWAALKNSGWTLGICDVIATGFDTSIDYGCFNIESDQKDVLYNIQYIQQLYGGILDWDSKNKVLNYRAENNTDYQAYNDGFNTWTGYEFREGKNMKDQPQVTYDNEIITRAYLLGYSGLNVKKVNNGRTYIDDFSYTKDIYEGYLEQPLIYDTNDEGGMKQLLYWGKKELSKKCRPRKTITINANDIRTVEKAGNNYSHEIFKLNDIVRVYSKESDSDVETYEEKRITLWEYNAFALWDSTVELGDKTQNFSELFKLIYNKSVVDAPQPNASGKISSEEIVMEFETGDFAYDLGGYDFSYGYGSDGYGIGGYGYGSTLSDYLSLIVQKTTDNSNAIAGLTMEATDLYAQAELFAAYQKQTDTKITETYAGLKVYADEKSSALEAIVEGNYTYLSGEIKNTSQEFRDSLKDVDYEIGQIQIQSKAQFTAIQNDLYAKTEQLSQYGRQIMDINGNIREITQSVADCVTYADADRAYAGLTADYTKQIDDVKGSIKSVIQSQAKFEAEANSKYATTTQLSSYATKNELTGAISRSEASIKTYAANNFASINLKATVDNLSSVVSITNNYVWLQNSSSRTAYLSLGSGLATLSATGTITINSGGTLQLDGNTVKIKGYAISWKKIYAFSSSTSTGKQSYYVLSR